MNASFIYKSGYRTVTFFLARMFANSNTYLPIAFEPIKNSMKRAK
jgi:hypothetical protein